MATQNKNLSLFDKADIPSAKGMCFGIVVANWNTEITSNLLDGAKETLLESGALTSPVLHTAHSPELKHLRLERHFPCSVPSPCVVPSIIITRINEIHYRHCYLSNISYI